MTKVMRSNTNVGNLGGFGMAPNRTAYGSQGFFGNFHSVFGSNNGTGNSGDNSNTSPLLDLSDFPSLSRGGSQGGESIVPSPLTRKQPYVGMVKQPTNEQTEFQMSAEDFPALPGSAPAPSLNSSSGQPLEKMNSQDLIPLAHSPSSQQSFRQQSMSLSSRQIINSSQNINSNHTPTPDALKKSHTIKLGLDGKVTNIPPSMVKDQFGMIGLLTLIRAAETEPLLTQLAIGQDLTHLGLNLNSPDNLYQVFSGPLSDQPCRAQDIDYHVPPEYIINHQIRDTLAPLKLGRFKEDLFFFLFYTNPGDVLQLAAAAELYKREWRYHMDEKIWITQVPGMGAVEKTSTYERGTYYYFDTKTWKKVPKEMFLEYSKLETLKI
ncbi:hypothetical protein M8J75_012832 [Diaphorina citri]|nr:hypothetical protein M8J75_012832 [Diaphorina citri]